MAGDQRIIDYITLAQQEAREIDTWDEKPGVLLVVDKGDMIGGIEFPLDTLWERGAHPVDAMNVTALGVLALGFPSKFEGTPIGVLCMTEGWGLSLDPENPDDMKLMEQIDKGGLRIETLHDRRVETNIVEMVTLHDHHRYSSRFNRGSTDEITVEVSTAEDDEVRPTGRIYKALTALARAVEMRMEGPGL